MKIFRLMSLVLLMLLISVANVFAAAPVGYDDLTILGIPYSAKKADIVESLGSPTKEGPKNGMDISYYVAFGGVDFNLATGNDEGRIVSVVVHNRDAETVRHVAVGDSVSKVINAYGKPYTLLTNAKGKEYRYFWGRPNTDDAHGIAFFCNLSGVVYQIVIYT